MTKPTINVTPLIDVLLVLLIIFMVVAPLKPSSFKTRVPQEPIEDAIVHPHPDTLVALVDKDGELRLNTESGLGDITDTSKLVTRLREVFDQRIANNDISESFADDSGRPFNDRIERSVFIKAPKGTGYGKVAGLIDAVKLAGAYPISLQIDGLDK